MSNQKKSFLKLTVTLLVFNLILGALTIMNVYKKNYELDKIISQNSQSSSVLGATSVPIFDRNVVMTNTTFSSVDSFPTEASVQSYLETVNSPLKNYTENGKRASFWIFSAARGSTSSRWGIVPNINPGVILAYLQKEQSLLTLTNYDVNKDPENRIKRAMGYGCPDTAACNTQYYGFSNQVNWAAYQLQYNFTLASNPSYNDPYKVNKTITTLDEYNVFLTTAATAANYRYTPHVYWGNYNLWKIITANGWGDSRQTYSMTELDNANLQYKDNPIPLPQINLIKEEDVADILKKDYVLGQQSEEIRLLQEFLRQEGYYMNREITGVFGVVTQEALQNYRASHGIITSMPSAACLALINQNWQIGTQSDQVAQLQQCLRDMGVFSFPSNTGYFGPITQSALETAKTAIANLQTQGAKSKTRCETLRDKTWKIGDTGSEVRELQDCMTVLGYYTWKYGSTGYFGTVTQEALNRWKKASSVSAPIEQGQSDSCTPLYAKSWTFGQQSQEVKSLQDCLTKEGFYTWKYGSTGYFGQVTQEALNAYKAAHQTTTPTPATPTPTPTPQPEQPVAKTECETLRDKTWKIGQVGDDVRKLQDCMTNLGYFNWKYGSTGYFGSATQEALNKWKSSGNSQNYCESLKSATWRMGETSQRVRDLQNCMTAAGKYTWKYGSTGYFGEVTKQALISWRGYF